MNGVERKNNSSFQNFMLFRSFPEQITSRRPINTSIPPKSFRRISGSSVPLSHTPRRLPASPAPIAGSSARDSLSCHLFHAGKGRQTQNKNPAAAQSHGAQRTGNQPGGGYQQPSGQNSILPPAHSISSPKMRRSHTARHLGSSHAPTREPPSIQGR